MGWDSAGGAGAGFRYAFRGAFGVKCYFLPSRVSNGESQESRANYEG